MSEAPKKIGELKPIVLDCPCGARATHGVDLSIAIADKVVKLMLPGCEKHAGGTRLTGAKVKVMPSHEAVLVRLAEKFPPRKAEVLAEPLMVGCPKCGSLASLDPTVFTLSEAGLEPSFVCPKCEIHVHLRLKEKS